MTGSLKIAQICPYDLGAPGGVQAQVLGLAGTLVREGHEVAVIGPGSSGAARADDLYGYRVLTVGETVEIEANGSLAPIAIRPSAVATTYRILRDNVFDVLHLHEPLVPGPTMACLVAAATPMVGTFHLSGSSASYKYLRPIVRRWAGRLAVRCAVSEAARRTAESSLGGDYQVLFNGVDLARFGQARRADAESAPSSAPHRTSVVFVGRHEPRKGLTVFLEAMRQLASTSNVPGLVARIAGEGPQTAGLKESFADLDGIDWLGRIDDDRVASLMRDADLVCVPSVGGESFGVVLIEAMAAGTPVVASDLPAYRAVAGGGAVLLVPPGDVAALVRGIADLLQDPARAASQVKAGRLRSEEFSMDALAARYESIYRCLL